MKTCSGQADFEKKKGARGKKKIDICFCDKGDQLIVQLITDSETIFDDLLKIIKARVFENGKLRKKTWIGL